MEHEDLRARLREQPAPVRYDVARGLSRHRALIDAGTQLPTWAQELPAARTSWLRRVAIWGGTLAVLTVLWARSTPERVVNPTHAPIVDATPSRERSVETRTVSRVAEAPATPQAPQAPQAPQRAVPEPAEPEAHAAVEARSTHTRSRSRAARAADTTTSESAKSARNPRVVAPQDNVELQQVVEAERALSFDPVRALRLAREGELSFRNGYFSQERHYIEVMALFALGRLGEAHAQAAAFLRDYPNGAYRRKIELELLRQPQH